MGIIMNECLFFKFRIINSGFDARMGMDQED